MTDREVMKQALLALNLPSMKTQQMLQQRDEAITALRAQLEQPEQKQHQPWCNSVTKLLLSNPPQIPLCNCKQEPVTQPEQEPVAWMDRDGDVYPMPENKIWAPPHTMLYTTPLLRKPLTDADIKLVMNGRGEEGDDDYIKPAFDPYGISEDDLLGFARAIEAAHGIREKP